MTHETQEDTEPERHDENDPGPESGGDSSAADKPPAAPAQDDDSELGDTDQHSSA